MSGLLNNAVNKCINLVEEKLYREYGIALHPDNLLSPKHRLLRHEQCTLELRYVVVKVYFNNSYFPTWAYLNVTSKEDNSTQSYSFSLAN